MPTRTLDTRAARLDLMVHPGNPRTYRVSWPTSLTGRTFVATVGDASLTVEVDGADILISVSEAQTAALTTATWWKLTETTFGTEDLIVGKMIPNSQGTASPEEVITVLYGESTIEVTVIGAYGDIDGGTPEDSEGSIDGGTP